MQAQTTSKDHLSVVTIISANTEWRAVRELYPDQDRQTSPYGEWFQIAPPEIRNTQHGIQNTSIIFFQGGWGKIAAAASTQYAIDRWRPHLLVNLGTCGGFKGEIERGEIILAQKTLVYDIFEQMGNPDEALAHYTTQIDLSWLKQPYPQQTRRTLLVSADRDLLPEDLPRLQTRYGAVAGDWESGAIAYVAARNKVRTLILRGVTDLVGSRSGEAYGNFTLFDTATIEIMSRLVKALPAWIRAASF